MINYSPGSLRAGDLLPDQTMLGETTARHLVALGIPEERVAIGGALRYAQSPRPSTILMPRYLLRFPSTNWSDRKWCLLFVVPPMNTGDSSSRITQ